MNQFPEPPMVCRRIVRAEFDATRGLDYQLRRLRGLEPGAARIDLAARDGIFDQLAHHALVAPVGLSEQIGREPVFGVDQFGRVRRAMHGLEVQAELGFQNRQQPLLERTLDRAPRSTAASTRSIRLWQSARNNSSLLEKLR